MGNPTFMGDLMKKTPFSSGTPQLIPFMLN